MASQGANPPDAPNEKLHEEIKNLELKRQKYLQELSDARRPYFLRNAELLTAILATLGAIVGLSVVTKTDYFGILNRESKRAQDEAALQKTEAEKTKREAETESKKASELVFMAKADKEDASRQMERETERLESAKRQAEVARARLDRVDSEIMDASGVPQYIVQQQGQLSALEVSWSLNRYSWIKTHSIKELICWVKDDSTLRSLPDSIESLTLNTRAKSLDLRNLQKLQGLRRLSIFSNTLERLSGLGDAHNLEELSFESYNRASALRGLEDVKDLGKLTNLSLEALQASFLTDEAFDRVTELLAVNSDTLQAEDIARIVRSKSLRSIEAWGDIDQSVLIHIQRARPLTTVIVIGPIHYSETDIFSNITKAHFPIEANQQPVAMFAAYPNLTCLSVALNGNWNAQAIQQLLKEIGERYPTLHSLSILPGIYSGPRYTLVLPSMADLETLRVDLQPLYPYKDPLMLSLEKSDLPSLRKLVINEYNLRPGDLPKLVGIESLTINDASQFIFADLVKLPKLKQLTIKFSDSANSQNASQSAPPSFFQEGLDSLRLTDILAPSAMSKLTHLPKTIRSLKFGVGLPPSINFGTGDVMTGQNYFE